MNVQRQSKNQANEAITQHIAELRRGVQPTLAKLKLSDYFFERIVQALAQQFRLRGKAGVEDVTNSALRIVFSKMERGEYQTLTDRNDLWKLLLTVAVRKALNKIRDEQRRQPKNGVVLREGDLPATERGESSPLDQLATKDLDPALAVQAEDQCQRLLDTLPEPLRQIAILKGEGLGTAEIAQQMGCHENTIRVKVELIKRMWRGELADE